jgi:acyl-coenzyme A thioesterase PaaI-like protein
VLLSDLIKKAETSAFNLWLLNNILWKKIPFNNPHKLTIEKIVLRTAGGENSSLTISLPYKRKNQNHIGGIHACALATLCEYISGLTLMSSISEKEYRIILKNIKVTYHYQAKMKVQATFSLSEEFLQKEILEPLKTSDSIFKELHAEVYDMEKNHICTGMINWQIKRWEKVKTKIV